jgi:integrase
MASFRKSTTAAGTQRWQAVWSEPASGGTVQRKTRNFSSKAEAKAFASRMEVEIERRGVGDPHKYTLASFVEAWLAYLERRGELSPSTLSAYRQHSKRAFPLIGHVPLTRVTASLLDDTYAALLSGKGRARPLSARSTYHVHQVIYSACGQAKKWRLLSENPCKDASAPTPERVAPRAFTAAEVDRLFAAAANREERTILSLLLITGIRRSELLALAVDAVDLDGGKIVIRRTVLDVDHVPVLRESTKSTTSNRTISIPPMLVELLREQKARTFERALKWGANFRREPMLLFGRVSMANRSAR